ncbi:CPBP family intramembrane metalloprotease [Fictibacillus sp. WQ 8-8]|uniref:CPBP family intramembrane glutamic endopeptidase n=1 Tax=Fictibacillus sp. WQ 8-8 TaxID=2938788 RepID=UPI0006A7BD8E|nr:type II CAAX endopeptidase family protein [Fictibacillus sp. WQ 8-8]MCQ6268236.1 CPBP family intramembrane metalloprotease [Fictibacillus sp. WQ 8-8]
MTKRYLWIVLTYVLMQLSGYVGYPLLNSLGIPRDHWAGLWGTISFLAALLIVLLLLIPDMKDPSLRGGRVSRSSAVGWAILGIFMAYGAQIIAGLIEIKLLGIKPGSENTQMLVKIAKLTPYFMVVTSIAGPILEEIIFRKIIFGSLYKRFNFVIAALISSLIFAAVHFDFTHLLVYTAMGFVFAFLYVRTKRLLVPIVAHVSMNTLVMLVQVVFADKINDLQDKAEKMQMIIGGLF